MPRDVSHTLIAEIRTLCLSVAAQARSQDLLSAATRKVKTATGKWITIKGNEINEARVKYVRRHFALNQNLITLDLLSTLNSDQGSGQNQFGGKVNRYLRYVNECLASGDMRSASVIVFSLSCLEIYSILPEKQKKAVDFLRARISLIKTTRLECCDYLVSHWQKNKQGAMHFLFRRYYSLAFAHRYQGPVSTAYMAASTLLGFATEKSSRDAGDGNESQSQKYLSFPTLIDDSRVTKSKAAFSTHPYTASLSEETAYVDKQYQDTKQALAQADMNLAELEENIPFVTELLQHENIVDNAGEIIVNEENEGKKRFSLSDPEVMQALMTQCVKKTDTYSRHHYRRKADIPNVDATPFSIQVAQDHEIPMHREKRLCFHYVTDLLYLIIGQARLRGLAVETDEKFRLLYKLKDLLEGMSEKALPYQAAANLIALIGKITSQRRSSLKSDPESLIIFRDMLHMQCATFAETDFLSDDAQGALIAQRDHFSALGSNEARGDNIDENCAEKIMRATDLEVDPEQPESIQFKISIGGIHLEENSFLTPEHADSKYDVKAHNATVVALLRDLHGEGALDFFEYQLRSSSKGQSSGHERLVQYMHILAFLYIQIRRVSKKGHRMNIMKRDEKLRLYMSIYAALLGEIRRQQVSWDNNEQSRSQLEHYLAHIVFVAGLQRGGLGKARGLRAIEAILRSPICQAKGAVIALPEAYGKVIRTTEQLRQHYRMCYQKNEPLLPHFNNYDHDSVSVSSQHSSQSSHFEEDFEERKEAEDIPNPAFSQYQRSSLRKSNVVQSQRQRSKYAARSMILKYQKQVLIGLKDKPAFSKCFVPFKDLLRVRVSRVPFSDAPAPQQIKTLIRLSCLQIFCQMESERFAASSRSKEDAQKKEQYHMAAQTIAALCNSNANSQLNFAELVVILGSIAAITRGQEVDYTQSALYLRDLCQVLEIPTEPDRWVPAGYSGDLDSIADAIHRTSNAKVSLEDFLERDSSASRLSTGRHRSHTAVV